MSSRGHRQPFIGSRAYNKANHSYVSFPSQADAMLASLQLFHDVPCRFMDLFLSVVTHSDFDAKSVTLHDSVDVINVVEEGRLEDRMAVVNKRAFGADGHAEQAGFPQFVLDEVLDIIHAERMVNVKKWFEKSLSNEEMIGVRCCQGEPITIWEDDIFNLKSLALVHRTWTWPAQKALGRVFLIGRPTHELKFPYNKGSMDVLLDPIRKSIFGPWTSVVAIQLFCPIKPKFQCGCDYGNGWMEYEDDDIVRESYCQWFENLHRIIFLSQLAPQPSISFVADRPFRTTPSYSSNSLSTQSSPPSTIDCAREHTQGPPAISFPVRTDCSTLL